ncbi:MAG: alpha/beta fold hydrolase [Spirochaetales bacterium]|nr:alpha/beta fold hydrolase [Spirochaetales bacterium]
MLKLKFSRFWQALLARLHLRPYFREIVPLSRVSLCLGRYPGFGQRVLLIHGLTGNHLAWQPVVTALKGFDVHAPDLRGRGRSDHPSGPYGIKVHAADMAEYLRRVGSAVVIGHSYGAMIALQLACDNPELVTKLILLDGGAPMTTVQRLKVMRFLLESLERVGPLYSSAQAYLNAARRSPIIQEWSTALEEHLLYELVPEGRKVRCAILPAVMEQELSGLGGSLRPSRIVSRFLRSPVRSVQRLRAIFPYERIRCPVLILKAGQSNLRPGDELVSYSGLAFMLEKIPRASAAVLRDLNHYELVLKEHAWRNDLIRNFLLTAQD